MVPVKAALMAWWKDLDSGVPKTKLVRVVTETEPE